MLKIDITHKCMVNYPEFRVKSHHAAAASFLCVEQLVACLTMVFKEAFGIWR
jgi:hypothetical protein